MSQTSTMPEFSHHTRIQNAYEKDYKKGEDVIQKMADEPEILKTLDGLKGTHFKFSVSKIEFSPGLKQKDGYQEPIGKMKVQLQSRKETEALPISIKESGWTLPHCPADTKNLKKVDLTIRRWIVDMEEKYNFDTEPAIKKELNKRTKWLGSGPRPE